MDEKTLARVQTLSELLMEEYTRDAAFADTCIRDLTEYLLLFLMRHAGSLAESAGDRSTFSGGALRYLYLHFRENPSVSEIAEACGYTPNYFCKLFRSVTGRTYTDFLNTLKINHAKMLLASTKMTVTEIAFSCGFTSLSNFYRSFRTETESVPLEWRGRKK
ncbi:MAG: helix-turn-helix transcriptional regulator [Clostridia bacterium]|nr:helix-turn-helix transcriptional regulator [Clostridia bacterium]